eukprot:scaffold29871_cov36-Phaeocystis_antarctica.AAC.3
MQSMFAVRSSPCPAPNLQSSPAPARCVHRGRPPPAASRATPSPCIVCPSFRLSAGRVCVQPAAECRHLQRHNHVRHVLGALLPEHAAPLCSRALPMPLAPLTPATSRLPVLCTSHHTVTTPYALLSNLGRTRRRSTSR